MFDLGLRRTICHATFCSMAASRGQSTWRPPTGRQRIRASSGWVVRAGGRRRSDCTLLAFQGVLRATPESLGIAPSFTYALLCIGLAAGRTTAGDDSETSGLRPGVRPGSASKTVGSVFALNVFFAFRSLLRQRPAGRFATRALVAVRLGERPVFRSLGAEPPASQSDGWDELASRPIGRDVQVMRAACLAKQKVPQRRRT